jgi:hypothetical protein
VALSLDVAYTLTKGGEVSAGVRAKFWVFASADARLKGTVSSEHAGTQQLTLTLKPRVEEVVIDQEGKQTTITRGVDVTGGFAEGEERPALPAP